MFSLNDPQRNRPVINALEIGLSILLGVLALVVVGGAVAIMLDMEASSQSQGGRYYVAIGALVILGFLDSQMGRVVKRRAPFDLGTTKPERVYAAVSLLLMIVVAVVLFALAYFLP
ncbi:MAG: hypothetical protein AB1750_03310 [Chloroflexota bacterium]